MNHYLNWNIFFHILLYSGRWYSSLTRYPKTACSESVSKYYGNLYLFILKPPYSFSFICIYYNFFFFSIPFRYRSKRLHWVPYTYKQQTKHTHSHACAAAEPSVAEKRESVCLCPHTRWVNNHNKIPDCVAQTSEYHDSFFPSLFFLSFRGSKRQRRKRPLRTLSHSQPCVVFGRSFASRQGS